MISGYLHCYNANGMRTQKKVGSNVTDYYYDSNNILLISYLYLEFFI